MKKEENLESELENLINSKIEAIKEQMKKEKITITFEKNLNLNIVDFHLNITIPDEKSQENYEFLLEINLVYNTIHLYSKNIKIISDCRDIYPDVMKESNLKNDIFNKDKFDLELLVKNIKLFISNLPNLLKESKKIGKFYLTKEYDIIFVKSLKYLNKIPCRHVEFVKGKKIITPCLCCIGNDFFCLYEYGNLSNKYLTNDEYKFTLVFYASVDALVKFRKLLEGPAVSLFWKKRTGEDDFWLKLESDIDKDMNSIIDLLIESMKHSGFKFDIEEKRYGEIPKVDIKSIEQQITNYELELQKNGNKELFNNLIASYEQAIVYYSAINDSQYVTYSSRVKELLKNEKYSKYLS